jgi:hypothetical protein
MSYNSSKENEIFLVTIVFLSYHPLYYLLWTEYQLSIYPVELYRYKSIEVYRYIDTYFDRDISIYFDRCISIYLDRDISMYVKSMYVDVNQSRYIVMYRSR